MHTATLARRPKLLAAPDTPTDAIVWTTLRDIEEVLQLLETAAQHSASREINQAVHQLDQVRRWVRFGSASCCK